MKTDQIEDSVLDEWAQRRLESRGAIVTWPGDEKSFVTPIKFYRQMIADCPPGEVDDLPSYGAFCFRLRSEALPACTMKRSASGRILTFVPTPLVVEFLKEPRTNRGGGRR